MRFGISSILWITGIVALFLGVSFAAPFIVTVIVLAFTMSIAPAVWITGAAFARGAKRAFFVGGVTSATLPHAIALYFMYMYAIEAIQGDWSSWFNIPSEELLMARVMIVVFWLIPGVFAVSGGVLGVVTRWLVLPKDVSESSEGKSFARPKSLDYQVVSGRLSTVAFDQAMCEPALADSNESRELYEDRNCQNR